MGGNIATGEKIYFGTSYIYDNATNLTFYDATVGATKTLSQLVTSSTQTLDNCFDQSGGKVIDGATSEANALQVGGSNDKLKIWEEGSNDIRLGTTAGANLNISAAGGTVNLNDENVTTTGKVTADGGLEVGADSVKLTLGADDDTDAYLQFDSANLDVYSSGGIDFLTGADEDDYLTLTTTSHVPVLGTSGNCNLKITASSGTIDFDDDNLTTTGNATAGSLTIASASITDTSGAISFGNENLTTQGTINIDADNVNLTLGDDGASDAKIFFSGSALSFWDSDGATTYTLAQLAASNFNNPTFTGNVTISDGKVTQTDTDDETAYAITSSVTSSNGISFTGAAVTSGTGYYCSLDESVVTSGYYFEAYDSNGASTVFGVKKYGEVEISGSATADILTISAGYLQIDNGKFEVDTTQDIGSYVKRNNATGTNPVLEVEQSHTTGGVAFLVDQDATGDVDAQQITNAGTGYSLSTTLANTAGEGLEIIFATGGAGNGIFLDGNTGTYVGANGTAMLLMHQTGTLAHANATCQFINFDGTYATNGAGGCLSIDDDGTADGTNYSVKIASTVNCMKIDTETATASAIVTGGAANGTASILVVDGVTNDWLGASGVGMLHLKGDGALAHAGSSLLYSTYTGNTGAIVPSGSCAYFYENGTIAAGGYAVGISATGGGALNVTQAGTGYKCINAQCAANATAAMINVDGTTNDWIGAEDVGMVHLVGDGTHAHADASMMYFDFNGTAAANQLGICMHMDLAGTTAGGGTEYAMYINSPTAGVEAIKIDAGAVVIDEDLTLNGANAANIGILRIGTTSTHGAANIDNTITLKNATTKPNGALADHASIYAEAGELEGIDAGGAETTLTPHSIEGDYMINSYDPGKGYTFRAHLELILDWLVDKFPEISSYVEKINGRAEVRPRQSHSPARVRI